MHVYTSGTIAMFKLQLSIKDNDAEEGSNKQIHEDSVSKLRCYLKTLPKTNANKPITNHKRTRFLIFLAFSRE